MYALTASGRVWAWGGQATGALGNGTTGTGFIYKPVLVKFPVGVKIKSLPVPMPAMTGMAIDMGGNVWGWGAALGGALCSTKENMLVPHEVTAPELKADVLLASGQNNFALYYTSKGKLYGCGANVAGQLGNGTYTNSDSPVRVVGLPAGVKVTSVQTSWENSGALLANGTYWDWGYNEGGQLGDNSKASSDVPVKVSLPAGVNTVSLGGSLSNNGQTLAILSNGSVYSWGTDQYGQLGAGYVHGHEGLPVPVVVPMGITFVSVSSGGAAEYAVDSTGDVWAWGDNNVGQLGIDNTVSQSSPVSVGLQANQVCSIAFDVAAYETTTVSKDR